MCGWKQNWKKKIGNERGKRTKKNAMNGKGHCAGGNGTYIHGEGKVLHKTVSRQPSCRWFDLWILFSTVDCSQSYVNTNSINSNSNDLDAKEKLKSEQTAFVWHSNWQSMLRIEPKLGRMHPMQSTPGRSHISSGGTTSVDQRKWKAIRKKRNSRQKSQRNVNLKVVPGVVKIHVSGNRH